MLAFSNYRARQGQQLPSLAAAEQVPEPVGEIRNTIIAQVQAEGTIDVSQFGSVDWKADPRQRLQCSRPGFEAAALCTPFRPGRAPGTA